MVMVGSSNYFFIATVCSLSIPCEEMQESAFLTTKSADEVHIVDLSIENQASLSPVALNLSSKALYKGVSGDGKLSDGASESSTFPSVIA